MPEITAIKLKLKNFITNEFASKSEQIDDDYQLMSNGLLDSIGALRLVSFIEEEFNIVFEPYEINATNIGSINILTKFITSKIGHGKT